ncbi:MAG: proton-conducting transporter membrane subunit, partial [Paracoccaceae bacterium]|nr:proton-conducting transporter membrane subunit [Paracoccaceae bacterium]
MTFLPYLAPLALALVAADLALRPVARAGARLRLPEIAALVAIVAAFGSAVLLALHGPLTAGLPGALGQAFSVRIDIVSVAMLATVSFVGWIVLRYARTALDGEAGQGHFMATMSATLAAVLLLVSAGNLVQLVLAWALVGVGLHRLLLFYPDRPRAQRAARKKTVSGIAGTAALLIAAGLLIQAFGTADIGSIAAAVQAGQVPATLWLAALLLAVAAVFKSALIPTHGWLTEVMEAPTPVSALLHAGVVNAGGFLLIRFADVLLALHGPLTAGLPGALGQAFSVRIDIVS